jgi:tetratricopeptide (TPR) repeat protein
VFALAKASLGDPHPAVRASAVRTLGRSSEAASSLSPLLNDPSRVVRIEAAWALSAQLGENSPARRELDEYLGLWLDQPGGRLQRGQDFAHRGMLSEAAAEMSTAAAWDPHSPGIRQSLGLVLAQLGQIDPAAVNLARAADLLSDDAAAAFDAGLALAEAGRAKDAERYLRAAVDRDPGFHRAWYNLGLILAEEERLGDAAEALRRAEQLAPGVKDYPAALAGVFQRLGDSAGARAAAERAAGIPSTSSPQQRLLRQK